jgi:hypothetical protein
VSETGRKSESENENSESKEARCALRSNNLFLGDNLIVHIEY